jgi:hypothetical protein
VIAIHRASHPDILVREHTLRVSYTITMNVVYQVIARELIRYAYSECKLGSSADMFHENLKLCLKNTRWTVTLFCKDETVEMDD